MPHEVADEAVDARLGQLVVVVEKHNDRLIKFVELVGQLDDDGLLRGQRRGPSHLQAAGQRIGELLAHRSDKVGQQPARMVDGGVQGEPHGGHRELLPPLADEHGLAEPCRCAHQLHRPLQTPVRAGQEVGPDEAAERWLGPVQEGNANPGLARAVTPGCPGHVTGPPGSCRRDDRSDMP